MTSFKQHFNEASGIGDSYWITPNDELKKIRPYGHAQVVKNYPEIFGLKVTKVDVYLQAPFNNKIIAVTPRKFRFEF